MKFIAQLIISTIVITTFSGCSVDPLNLFEEDKATLRVDNADGSPAHLSGVETPNSLLTMTLTLDEASISIYQTSLPMKIKIHNNTGSSVRLNANGARLAVMNVLGVKHENGIQTEAHLPVGWIVPASGLLIRNGETREYSIDMVHPLTPGKHLLRAVYSGTNEEGWVPYVGKTETTVQLLTSEVVELEVRQ